MSDIRRPIDTRVTPQPLADVMAAAQRAAIESLAAELQTNRKGAVLLAGAAGAPAKRAADALAASLGASVLLVDVRAVVSKYIGETEKNLDAVFKDAERTGAVVLLDEADELLGKRSEVQDARDRYDDLETNYLLQRVEAFNGLVILATNLQVVIEPATKRRLRRIIEYTPRQPPR